MAASQRRIATDARLVPYDDLAGAEHLSRLGHANHPPSGLALGRSTIRRAEIIQTGGVRRL